MPRRSSPSTSKAHLPVPVGTVDRHGSVLCRCTKAKRGEHPWLICKVADQHSHGKWQLLDQGWHSQHPPGGDHLGLLIDVDDLQVVTAGTVLVAQIAQPTHRLGGGGCGSVDEQRQLEPHRGGLPFPSLQPGGAAHGPFSGLTVRWRPCSSRAARRASSRFLVAVICRAVWLSSASKSAHSEAMRASRAFLLSSIASASWVDSCSAPSPTPVSTASAAARAEPVNTPSGPMYTGTSLTPSLLSRNSRIWFECAMPRLLSTYSPRLRSPLSCIVMASSQVSTSEEMLNSVCSRSLPPSVSEVITAVIPANLR